MIKIERQERSRALYDETKEMTQKTEEAIPDHREDMIVCLPTILTANGLQAALANVLNAV